MKREPIEGNSATGCGRQARSLMVLGPRYRLAAIFHRPSRAADRRRETCRLTL